MKYVELLQGWDLWVLPLLLYIAGFSATLSVLTHHAGRVLRRALIYLARSLFIVGALTMIGSVLVYALVLPPYIDDVYVISAMMSATIAAMGIALEHWVARLTRPLRRGTDHVSEAMSAAAATAPGVRTAAMHRQVHA